MLDGLVAWVLNNYLGKYVENLNTYQLSIAILSGKVELENLPLRRDALRHLGLPVEIKTGFIGKIKLQIPVSQIRSAPWVIAFEQLYIVASPLPVHEFDVEAEELVRQEQKLRSLDTIEARWRLETDVKDVNSTYYASSYSSWLTFGTGLISNIIENIQLKIQDVHVRYEDSISIPGKTIAFGVTMDSLSAQSCDSNWVPGFSQWANSGESFKILELQNFAVYCIALQEDESMSNINLGDLAVAMSPSQTLKNTQNYILPPLSAIAHLRRNRSEQPLRSTDTARYICDLLLEEVPIVLVDWQYDRIVKCIQGLDVISRLRSYRRYRPNCTVKEDPLAWWVYGINCLYPGKQPNLCKPRPTWETCLIKAKQNVQYVKLYLKILLNPNITLAPDDKKTKDDIEWAREYEELRILREVAMRSVQLPHKNSNNGKPKGRTMLQNWFPTWMGWYSGSTETNTSVSPDTTQLEGEILQVLVDSVEDNTILRRDAVFGQFNFTLKRGCLSLCAMSEDSDESSPMLELEFKNLSLNILSKPRTSSHSVELSLGSLYLKDKITLNTMFPTLMGPAGDDRATFGRTRGPSPRVSVASRLEEVTDLFYLAYDKKPQNSNCDYRLCIRSKCLDIIYQPNAVRWLAEFVCLPHQRDIAHSRIEAMKSRTKKELIKNWEQILDGRVVARTSWQLELDISAPQIIFVENFCDQNSAMAVIDFGRLQLRNNPEKIEQPSKAVFVTKESEEDEMFVTPCSTPPTSQASTSEETTEQITHYEQYPTGPISEYNLHHRLYDRYFLELTDLQLLVGKVKDNWRFAHIKGTSQLHVLDRFNISIQIERRVLYTSDPQFPSLTLCANLPTLVAHLNESKIHSARNLAQIITTTGLPSPFKTVENNAEIITDTHQEDEESVSLDTSVEMSRLLMVQFTVDKMSLEVQSRGRSVAELQVTGVKVALTKRMVDLSVTLTVHSLLLADALQTFGADFELLVASHKHVGMDSMSGSIRDSEPTSPTSPGSPDPNVVRQSATSPVALSKALNSLATSPPLRWTGNMRPTIVDVEALITIEVLFISGSEPMQIANVQFNNLDIIANQETIVELMGFYKRVFPKTQRPDGINFASMIPSSIRESTESLSEDSSKINSTQITFDFHRLNVLLLRGTIKDGMPYGKKICTATMSDARIHATVGTNLEVEGSLGGLQVLDLTPEGNMHQRIVSVGRDPLLESPHPLYAMSFGQTDEQRAFSFQLVRNLQNIQEDKDTAHIMVRMASLWYTHSPQFVTEIQSCATEFKQYLSNLARSIRSAATDMALGLVHARAEALAQSLYMNTRLDTSSPRRIRRRSSSTEPSVYCSARDTVLQTPYSPNDDEDFIIDIKLDIELDSPVVVLPRASNSPQVFVAHLGKINISNKYANECERKEYEYDYAETRLEYYDIEIRDMNLFSLDTSSRRIFKPKVSRPEELYSCESHAKPILHDTVIQLNIEREITKASPTRNSSESNLLLEDSEQAPSYKTGGEFIQISGTVVTALKVSLTRAQYEQTLDTLQWLTSSPVIRESEGMSRIPSHPPTKLADISEEDMGVTTLNMDPHVRAKLFPAVNISKTKNARHKMVSIKVDFNLPVFTIELRGDSPTGELGLVDLSFREFDFKYEKCHQFETNIQVSLRSIFMEDLLQPEDSRQRTIVISSSGGDVPPSSACVSRSCPDVTYHTYVSSPSRGSLPDHLETAKIFGIGVTNKTHQPNHLGHDHKETIGEYPSTPPPSPNQGRVRQERNLVLISTLLVDPAAPNFDSYYNSVQRSTSVDFNCLDLVISVETWIVVIDFFSANATNHIRPEQSTVSTPSTEDNTKEISKENSETNINVCSLTVVLVKTDRDIAKVNISNVDVSIRSSGVYKEVKGNLGSLSLLDLTLHGQLYKERFYTSGKQALEFQYIRHIPGMTNNYDAHLNLKMCSVIYVHTKRFVAELNAFFNHFTQLQSVMKSIRDATSGQMIRDDPLKLSLNLQASSPIILLPVSSKSSDLLIIDLGQLSVTNSFKFSGDESTISVVSKPELRCLLDVMLLELENMDLYTGVKESDLSPTKSKHSLSKYDSFKLGASQITKKGGSLLTKKFELRLHVERNLHKDIYHSVPDMSIYGQLSTLDGTLDLPQYRLIRGLLAFNLGEDTERILPSVAPQVNVEVSNKELWTLSSLKLDLQNVNLSLVKEHNSTPLTCINFIKSLLTIESFSNLSQDIDLVSQEVLVKDTRSQGTLEGVQYSAFTNILQPIKLSAQNDLVQAEIHSRKRQDKTKFTILLNNMRLMAIFDWWEEVQDYIFQEIENVSSSPEHTKKKTIHKKVTDESSFELKLNITDCEIVLVEDTSEHDSNAVIFKSTTVVSYRPLNVQKPLSCNLNNCEMFSCTLGKEDETALSIIDPVTLNMDINGNKTLEVQLQFLTVRLSYHDMCMFLAMLNSLPKQMFSRKNSKQATSYVSKVQVGKLATLGFDVDDCIEALEECNTLEDAALWLTHNASHSESSGNDKSLKFTAVEVKADCISMCIIDDCGDSDVPLLELSFSNVVLNQLLPELNLSDPINPQGSLQCSLASDYYNRVLSGWEPILEPWNCKIGWEKCLSSDLLRNRFIVKVESQETLNANITSTLIELYRQVKETWTKDYYNAKDLQFSQNLVLSTSGYRRRSPFVPFALKNDTGSPVYFTTIITETDKFSTSALYKSDEHWIVVDPGDTVPFSFTNRVKIRHQDSHKMKLHQLVVKVEGWQPLEPVTVDKVGVFFRHASAQIQSRTQRDTPPARIVFDISLEGSARKLVTLRSALLILNKLPQPIDVKLESCLPHDAVTLWVPSQLFTVETGSTLSVPLVHAHSQVNVRPTGLPFQYTFCSPSILWSQMPSTVEKLYELRTCHTHKGHNFRFCAALIKDKLNVEKLGFEQPAHRIILLPTVKLVNLLPLDLNYKLSNCVGRIQAGSNAAVTEVDADEIVELNVRLENFSSSTTVVVAPGSTQEFTAQIRLDDDRGRKLYLRALVSPNKDAKLKITVSAPYWIINKTGLPLVFRQSGASSESAGQFEEHELGRMMAPLLFSFSDQEASPTINARVGYHVVRDGSPQWCSNFAIQKGTQVRKLRVAMHDGKPDTIFVVGIEVRTGRGKYRSTHVVTISPRYQLNNRSSYRLMFTQSCFANSMRELNTQKNCIKAMPNSHTAFHWPKLEKEQLLCVLIEDIPGCCWSGGLQIDMDNSMHVNVRDMNNRVYFLRLEVVLQGATFFIVFTDADKMPPPIRIDNFSEVPITFCQSTYNRQYSIARAHSSFPYAWDHPTGPQSILLLAPGDVANTYDINKLGEAADLTYENFIYIAFVGTFKNSHTAVDPFDVESQELVLDVAKNNRVILARKRQGERSQLWRMTSEGQLQHEGSSPPVHPHQSRSFDSILVLDIEATAPQPTTYSRLMLRKIDPRRRSTQKWRFTEDGRLCCDHYNMCVQAQDGFFGLREGNCAVLGLPQPVCHKLTDNGIPIEQAIGRQRLRPGSGFLSVKITMHGPTRVINIKDKYQKQTYATPDDRDWSNIAVRQRPNLMIEEEDEKVNREYQFVVHLHGIGISLVCKKTPEELLYAEFSMIVGETIISPDTRRFCVTVGDVQIDNQLLEAPVPVVLYVTPPNSRGNDEFQSKLPAIDFNAEIQQTSNENATIFKYLILRLKKITVIIEEWLLLKFFAFYGFHSQEEELINRDENDYEAQQLISEVCAASAKRYYFGVINLIPDQIKLSVKTASKLPDHLQRIKKKLGLKLIKFEDAAVDLEAFDRRHPFETSQFLINSIIKHFKDELKWQAGIILGSVDFLGNPLGFVNDVSEGFSGLINEGNVGALFKNVTHGLSNSAAKVTESLSDGLGKVTMDDCHEEMRQRIRQLDSGSGKDHLVAGIKGLGFGFLGGATGIFKQVYEGAATDGVQGVFSGMAKGLVGAVTKPVVGVLDFASETARAVRDSSRSKLMPERHRPPRCVHGAGGLLPRYNLRQSQGQQYLYIVNNKNYEEHLVAYQILGSASEDLQCIISNKRVRIVTSARYPEFTSIIDCNLSNLETCNVISDKEGGESRHYIELVMHVTGPSAALVNPDPVRKPRVRCKTLALAHTVSQQINYAKRLYIEHFFTLSNDNITNGED